MSHTVTISGKLYRATKRLIRSGVYSAVFTALDKSGQIILPSVIRKTTGYVGSNGVGPFGGPDQKVALYEIEGWGSVTKVTKEVYEYLASTI
jgi:hypothetical protein